MLDCWDARQVKHAAFGLYSLVLPSLWDIAPQLAIRNIMLVHYIILLLGS